MKNVTLFGKWVGVAFAGLLLAACSSNNTKEADAAAVAAAEQAAQQAAQEAAAQEAAQQAEAEAQRALEVAAADVGTVFYFGFDSSSLTDEARAQVDAHVAALLGNNDSIRLEGHTDERGTREYNLALGERRANAVRDYMVANGVPSYRIETISYGEENPVAYGSGESNWEQNRRVELK
jgi:peptidoglycan-associated lipoprotein